VQRWPIVSRRMSALQRADGGQDGRDRPSGRPDGTPPRTGGPLEDVAFQFARASCVRESRPIRRPSLGQLVRAVVGVDGLLGDAVDAGVAHSSHAVSGSVRAVGPGTPFRGAGSTARGGGGTDPATDCLVEPVHHGDWAEATGAVADWWMASGWRRHSVTSTTIDRYRYPLAPGRCSVSPRGRFGTARASGSHCSRCLLAVRG